MKISLEYINNFRYGIENACRVTPNKFSKIRQIKLCIYYLLLFLILPYKKINANSIFFINGRNQRNMKFEYADIADKNIYHGFCYRSIREIRKLNTIITPIKRRERLKLIVYVFYTYGILRSVGITLWLEYNIFAVGLKNIGMRTVCSRGHYDEITTWISGFADLYGFKFDIYQHGVVMNNLNIPHKIKCNNFWAFDKYSINVFKNNFLDISYRAEVYNFKPSVKFEVLKRKKGKIYIGIIDQCNEEWIDLVIESIKKSLNNCIFIVMLHPLSKHKFSKKDNEVLIEHDKKFLNLDYVLTESSTLIIDYYRQTATMPIFFTASNMKTCFLEYPFQYIDREKIGETIKKMETNKTYEESIYCCK